MEYIYIFTNPAMPDWVKVGKTNDIKRRLNDLSNTSVPLDFECYAYMEVPDGLVFVAEKSLHNLIKLSYDKEKEYFRMSPEQVLEYFQILAPNNPKYRVVTVPELDDTAAAEKVKTTTFEMLGIEPGTTLYYVFDDTFTCTTADKKNKVLHNGKETTLSGLAKSDLNYVAISGFKIFSLEPQGETLWDRRLRLEKN